MTLSLLLLLLPGLLHAYSYGPEGEAYSYHGNFPGQCEYDGLYYRDVSSFILCSNGIPYEQHCAPGSQNSGYDKFTYGSAYSKRNFCDVNLVDQGFVPAHVVEEHPENDAYKAPEMTTTTTTPAPTTTTTQAPTTTTTTTKAPTTTVYYAPEPVATKGPEPKSAYEEPEPTEPVVIYFGKFEGKCGPDGLYFRNDNSFIFCVHGNPYVQPCAPGTQNSPFGKYEAGDVYSYRDFCDVNLVDGQYGSHDGYGYEYAKPSYQPEPRYEEPAPAPVYEEPAPAPRYEASAPVYEEPAPRYQAPEQPPMYEAHPPPPRYEPAPRYYQPREPVHYQPREPVHYAPRPHYQRRQRFYREGPANEEGMGFVDEAPQEEVKETVEPQRYEAPEYIPPTFEEPSFIPPPPMPRNVMYPMYEMLPMFQEEPMYYPAPPRKFRPFKYADKRYKPQQLEGPKYETSKIEEVKQEAPQVVEENEVDLPIITEAPQYTEIRMQPNASIEEVVETPTIEEEEAPILVEITHEPSPYQSGERTPIMYNEFEEPKYTFHGNFSDTCRDDGLYYRDEYSFVYCSGGNSFVQPCAPGTQNSGSQSYQPGKHYSYREFCTFNLVDDGYTVKYGYAAHEAVAKRIALEKESMSTSEVVHSDFPPMPTSL